MSLNDKRKYQSYRFVSLHAQSGLNACVQTRKCDKKVAEFGNTNANHAPILIGSGYQVSFSSNFIQFFSLLLL